MPADRLRLRPAMQWQRSAHPHNCQWSWQEHPDLPLSAASGQWKVKSQIPVSLRRSIPHCSPSKCSARSAAWPRRPAVLRRLLPEPPRRSVSLLLPPPVYPHLLSVHPIYQAGYRVPHIAEKNHPPAAPWPLSAVPEPPPAPLSCPYPPYRFRRTPGWKPP